jgi:phage terminase Nu1 subunit (DNA packaging protein)
MTIVQLPRRGNPTLDKKALARTLGVSTRTIENYAKQEMPTLGTDRFGRRLYSLEAVQEWIKNRPAAPPMDRLSLLEARVTELERKVSA